MKMYCNTGVLFVAIIGQFLIGQVQIISGTSEPVLCDKPVDIVLAIDSSGSVSSYWNNSIDYAERLLSNFNIGNNDVRAGVIDFSMIANAMLPLSSGSTLGKLYQTLEDLRHRPQNGETHTELALNLASKMFADSLRPDSVPKVLVLITDGELTSGYYQTLDTPLRNLDALKVVRFVVREGDYPVAEGLNKLASKPSYEYIFDLTPGAKYSLYPTQSLASSICFAKFSQDVHGFDQQQAGSTQQQTIAPQQQTTTSQQQTTTSQQQTTAPQQEPAAGQQQAASAQEYYVGIPLHQTDATRDQKGSTQQQPLTAQQQQSGSSFQYSGANQQQSASYQQQASIPQQATTANQQYPSTFQQQQGISQAQASATQQQKDTSQQQFGASQQEQTNQQQGSQFMQTPASLRPLQQPVGNPKQNYPEEFQKQPFPSLPDQSGEHNTSLTIQQDKGFLNQSRVPSCNLNVTKVGCFNDDGTVPRPLSVNILQEKANKFSNGVRDPSFNRMEWESFLPDFICRCANIARQRKYWTFGIQNYNECYSGDNEGRYDEDGAAEPSKCKNSRGQICDDKSEYCAGDQNVNFVYTILSPQHPSIVKIEYD